MSAEHKRSLKGGGSINSNHSDGSTQQHTSIAVPDGKASS